MRNVWLLQNPRMFNCTTADAKLNPLMRHKEKSRKQAWPPCLITVLFPYYWHKRTQHLKTLLVLLYNYKAVLTTSFAGAWSRSHEQLMMSLRQFLNTENTHKNINSYCTCVSLNMGMEHELSLLLGLVLNQMLPFRGLLMLLKLTKKMH